MRAAALDMRRTRKKKVLALLEDEEKVRALLEKDACAVAFYARRAGRHPRRAISVAQIWLTKGKQMPPSPSANVLK
jgi:hypothetical protein